MMEGWHGMLQPALDKLSGQGDQRTATLLVHGTLKVMLFAPKGSDPQIPHDRDEVYVIVKGSGRFVLGERDFSCKAGEVIFVPAGVEHRFVDFTDDLAAWVLFFGPKGGEQVE